MIDFSFFEENYSKKLFEEFDVSLKIIDNISMIHQKEKRIMKIGLPDWIAPHIYFYDKFILKRNSVHLGNGGKKNTDFFMNLSTHQILGISNNLSLYVNKDLISMIFFAYNYQAMVCEALEIVGDEAFTNNLIPDKTIQQFTNSVTKYDERAMQSDSFWAKELNYFK